MRILEIQIVPAGYFKAIPYTIGMTDEEVDTLDWLSFERSNVIGGTVRCAMQYLAEVEPKGCA